MTSHWPTFADGKFWCACDNRTFDTEEAWLDHVVEAVLDERESEHFKMLARIDTWIMSGGGMPPKSAVEQPHRGD